MDTHYHLPLWDIWIQKLTPNLTATAGTHKPLLEFARPSL